MRLIGLFAVLVPGLVALDPPVVMAQGNEPIPLPDVVAAWKKAGADVGWVDREELAHYMGFRIGAQGKTGEIPVFWFKAWNWKPGTIAKLPPVAFGLDFHDNRIGDLELKQLAALKNLQWLDLSSTNVSTAGLKSLAALNNLQYLGLVAC